MTATEAKKSRCRNCAMATGRGESPDERCQRIGPRLYCGIWDTLVKPSYHCLLFSEPDADQDEDFECTIVENETKLKELQEYLDNAVLAKRKEAKHGN